MSEGGCGTLATLWQQSCFECCDACPTHLHCLEVALSDGLNSKSLLELLLILLLCITVCTCGCCGVGRCCGNKEEEHHDDRHGEHERRSSLKDGSAHGIQDPPYSCFDKITLSLGSLFLCLAFTLDTHVGEKFIFCFVIDLAPTLETPLRAIVEFSEKIVEMILNMVEHALGVSLQEYDAVPLLINLITSLVCLFTLKMTVWARYRCREYEVGKRLKKRLKDGNEVPLL